MQKEQSDSLRLSCLELFQHRAAALADIWVIFIFSDAGRIIPAPVALRAFSFFDLDPHPAAAIAGALDQCYG